MAASRRYRSAARRRSPTLCGTWSRRACPLPEPRAGRVVDVLRVLIPLVALASAAAAGSGAAAPASQSAPTRRPSPSTTVQSATAGDVDGDAQPDVVTVTPS